jgi:type IV pilus assembly protein PilW
MRISKSQKQLGFTLVELMVALALSLLVVAASVSALLVSRQGFASVDAASQLRDNARFATDFITRLSVQSGFKDVAFVDTTGQTAFKATGVAADPDSPVFGFNNALVISTTDPVGTILTPTTTNNSRDTNCPVSEGTACANGSDVLVLRYQNGSRNTDSPLGSGVAEVDNAMFNCAGIRETSTPTSSNDYIESMLYVAVSGTTNEPTLMCRYRTGSGASWVTAGTPLVQGVESFQILYGTDGVMANTIPVAAAPLGTAPDQLTVASNEPATKENWRRVRSLRIGLVIRGAVGSAQDTSSAPALMPLGTAFANPTADRQSSFVQIPPTGAAAGTGDGRLRQVVTFTVYLHNYQGI